MQSNIFNLNVGFVALGNITSTSFTRVLMYTRNQNALLFLCLL